MSEIDLDEQYEHAALQAAQIGWLEAATENGGGWATGFVQRDKSGPPTAHKTWLPADADGQWAALEKFLRTLLVHGRGAARVQISRALWGIQPANGKVGSWLGNDPIIPKAGGLLRADLDIAEGHTAPEGQRLPTMSEALSAVIRFQRTVRWGPALHVYNSGGGLTVITRHPDADDLIERWLRAWRAVAAAGGWYLDEGACRGHGGLRLAGSMREGVRIDCEPFTVITGPRPVRVDRGQMLVHEPWRLVPAGGATTDHALPEIPAEVKPQYGDGEYDEAEGDAPWDRMSSAIRASVFVEEVYGWSREGDRLRQPGSTLADTWIGDGEGVEVIYPHSASDSMALGLPISKGATSYALLGAALDEDWALATRVARHFDAKWGELISWVSENDSDLVDAAVDLLGPTKQEKAAQRRERAEIVKAFDSLFTVADLGANPAEYLKASQAARAYARRKHLEPYAVMESLINKRLAK